MTRIFSTLAILFLISIFKGAGDTGKRARARKPVSDRPLARLLEAFAR